jgi:curved DNA-binding protein CbpA
MQTDAPSYYDVLGVKKDADPAAIKGAYRTMAKQWHPDKNHGDATATEKFKIIAEAYGVLSDADKRAEYDRTSTTPPVFDSKSWTPEPRTTAPHTSTKAKPNMDGSAYTRNGFGSSSFRRPSSTYTTINDIFDEGGYWSTSSMPRNQYSWADSFSTIPSPEQTNSFSMPLDDAAFLFIYAITPQSIDLSILLMPSPMELELAYIFSHLEQSLSEQPRMFF